jgi:hypothetical protein
LRVGAELPDGTSVRCSACQTSFRYCADSKAAAAAKRTKELTCPGCARHFVAALTDENKVECPGCRARIAIRKTRKTRLQTTPEPEQRSAVASAHKKTKLERDSSPRKTKLAASAPEPRTAARRKNSSGWVAHPSRTNIDVTPPSGRPAPGQDQASTISIVLAATLLLAVGAYPAWSLVFAEVKRETVRGVVTFEGKPLAGGTVVLQGEDGVSLQGMIKPDGSYVVNGVPRGKVLIAVKNFDPPRVASAQKPSPIAAIPMPSPDGDAQMPSPLGSGSAEFKTAEADKEDDQGWFPIPDHFGHVNRSGLSIVVKDETTHNIELK